MAKLTVIREKFHLSPMAPAGCLPSWVDENLLFWMIDGNRLWYEFGIGGISGSRAATTSKPAIILLAC